MQRSETILAGVATRGIAVLVAITLGVGVAIAASGWTLVGAPDGSIHPATMTVIVGLASIPLIRWASDGDLTIQRIMTVGLIAKAVGTAARVTFNTAGADAGHYNRVGARIAEVLGSEFVTPGDPRFATRGTGTNNLSYLVGWLYNFTGARLITAYVVFSFIGFVGMVLFYRAATIALPELDRVRYALLLFLLPSMLFWPSSLGKDAFVVGCLGLASLGAAGLARHRYSASNLGALILGTGLTAWVRPHIAALLAVSLGAALAWPSRGGGRLRQWSVVAVALLAITALLGQVAGLVGQERFEITSVLEETESRTSEDDARFDAVRVSGPLSFALATITVLGRPLIFEARSLLQVLTAAEAMALLFLGVASMTRVRRLPRAFLEEVYVRLIVVYTLGFIMAFSVISNFGILARQRVQLWPFLLVLLAFPRPGGATRWRLRRRSANRASSERTESPSPVQPAAASDRYVP